MDAPVAKRKKIDEGNKVLNQIKANEIEEVQHNGRSPAWKKFVKLRLKATKTFIDYVQCKDCKVLRSYSRKNGTSTLNSHICHNEDESGEIIFKEISEEKASELKTILMQKLMEFCAEDVIPVQIIAGSGFLRFVHFVASATEKYGKVNFKSVLPSQAAITRYIQNFKSEQQIQIAESFKSAFMKNLCSLSMNIWQPDTNKSEALLITSVSRFNDELTAVTKEVLFTIPVEEHCNYEKVMSQIQKNMKTLGCDEMKKDMYIVTPMKDIFIKTLNMTCNRENCMAFVINLILKTSLSTCNGNDFSEIMFNCKDITRHINETEKNTKLKHEVIEEGGTWKSKVDMIKSLTCQYNDVINLLNDDGKAELKFNNKKAEELSQFLQVFVEAIDDLQSTTHTTVNKILPWWAILLDHLTSTNEYSIGMKIFMQQVKSIFEAKFIPTLSQKVACFLDPRYRRLKMLPENERTDVAKEVRRIMDGMHAEVPRVSEEPSTSKKKKSKFCRFEADEDDVGEKDEVNIYLHSTQLNTYSFDESEIEIVSKFWKNNEQKLPKLYKMAITRLHTPACCCGGNKSLQSKTFQLSQFDDLLLVRDNLPGIN